MFYIKDEVIKNLEKKDYFDGESYALLIKEAIYNKDIKSIGLYGKWGIGKTTIIKNVIKKLKTDKKYNSKQIVEYNAWKYNEYDFMRDFLIVCSKQLESDKKSIERENSYYSDQSSDTHIYKLFGAKLKSFLFCNMKLIAIMGLVLLAFGAIVLIVHNYNPTWYDNSDLLTPLFLTFLSFIIPLFLVSEVIHKNSNRKFSPEQFERDFKTIVKDKKVVIFIDDIDRCNAKEIRQTFDTLKTFLLDSRYNVKFVIPVDPQILNFDIEDRNYAYFTKIFDYSIEIKEYIDMKYDKLVTEILTLSDSKYKIAIKDGLNLASKHYIDTPRKMKSFSNEFVNELYKYEPVEIKNKGSMFAKLIILKNEFPNFYDNVLINYNQTSKITDKCLAKYEDVEEGLTTKDTRGIKMTTKLFEFLSKTKSVDIDEYSLYAYGISYAEFKLKALCENPIIKNEFNPETKINLDKNYKWLEKQFTENIFTPIKEDNYIPGEPLKKTMFLLSELNKQEGLLCLEEVIDKIIIIWDELLSDKLLTVLDHNDASEEYERFDMKYFISATMKYLAVIDLKNIKDNETKMLEKISSKILLEYEKDPAKFNVDVIDYIGLFKNLDKISNKTVIKLLEAVLNSDFKKYHSDFSWYFVSCVESSDISYVNKITALIEKDELDVKHKEIFEKYINKKYEVEIKTSKTSLILEKAEVIKTKPESFDMLIKATTANIALSKEQFQVVKSILEKLDYFTQNDSLNLLVIKLLNNIDQSGEYSKEEHLLLLEKFGAKLNELKYSNEAVEKYLIALGNEFLNRVLNYDEGGNIYVNIEILKANKNIFKPSIRIQKNFSTIVKSYLEANGYVIETDVSEHGFDLNKNKNQIQQIIKVDINNTIHLANKFSKSDFDSIDITLLDPFKINSISSITNPTIKRQIKDSLNKEITVYVNQISFNRSDVEIIKAAFINFLKSATILYGKMNNDRRKFWKSLKTIEPIMDGIGLFESEYLPNLKKTVDLVGVFKEGKWIQAYKNDNKYAERVIKYIEEEEVTEAAVE